MKKPNLKAKVAGLAAASLLGAVAISGAATPPANASAFVAQNNSNSFTSTTVFVSGSCWYGKTWHHLYPGQTVRRHLYRSFTAPKYSKITVREKFSFVKRVYHNNTGHRICMKLGWRWSPTGWDVRFDYNN